MCEKNPIMIRFQPISYTRVSCVDINFNFPYEQDIHVSSLNNMYKM